MDDYELLKSVAKIAGYTTSERTSRPSVLYVNGEEWNPLESDNDMLALAMKFNLDLHFKTRYMAVSVADDKWNEDFEERVPSEADEATRRSVMRRVVVRAVDDFFGDPNVGPPWDSSPT